VGTFGISRDITDRKKAEAQLQHQAFYDSLTDLPNRALFLDRLQHLFSPGPALVGQSEIRGTLPRFSIVSRRSMTGSDTRPEMSS